ncbi:pyrimidine reductase family protein [Galbitalea soli]|uniref:Pyrimidine reductase family protein n=1 Tax=Galbitalea soli TaxID=1268042 RepID=A0A7C9PPR1_9MICO|nr:pyrimidine reductase family protein [Galbitalea soli]NEM92386.1 pyrimidine reductase family protein [Galbitalea soli]NYJ31657.1 riboflavin biosynthesis pyrimidine reductase [Galbitalea soli]
MTSPRIDLLRPAPAAELSDEQLRELYTPGTGSWLRVNFISSVDGAVTVDGLSGGLGGPADHRVFDLLRELCDVVLVAAGTVRAEGYGPMVVAAESVAVREARGLAPQPVFAIVSASLDLDPASRIFTEAPVRPIVVTTESSPADSRRALAAVADVIVCGTHALDAGMLVRELHARGLAGIHCEGGPSLFGALLAADVVDELCLTVSPLLVAGDAGRIASGSLPDARSLHLAHVLASGDELLLRYLRRR